MVNSTLVLPNGHVFWMELVIPDGEAKGILLLTVVSSVSAFAVLALLGAIAISAWNTRTSTDKNLFVRGHAVGYLVSLLLCDLCQAIGSIMNAKWYKEHAVSFQGFCIGQGVLKQIADVGIAIWALVIAGHTFWVLFLRWPLRRPIMFAALALGWSSIGTIVISGPAALNMRVNGPFFGISGYWCWISEEYSVARVTLDYLWMFISAFLSFVLYSLVFLRLRGNILVQGSRLRFRLHHRSDVRCGLSADGQTIKVAKNMLFYPFAYTALILPIGIVRFAEWAGNDIPFAATIFCDVVYLLSGLVNVCLFIFTRRVLPRHSVITKRFGRKSAPMVPPLKLSARETSFMTEKMDEDLESEKTFRDVDSPDAEEHLNFARHLPVVPPKSARSGHLSPLRWNRDEFPASAGSPMAYPQSPLYSVKL